MGIPSIYFLDRLHEQFICAICLDVVSNPVATNDCDHMFCKECVDQFYTNHCPYCKQELQEPKWTTIKGSTKRIYLDLQMRCSISPLCNKLCYVTNFNIHTCHYENRLPDKIQFETIIGLENLYRVNGYISCNVMNYYMKLLMDIFWEDRNMLTFEKEKFENCYNDPRLNRAVIIVQPILQNEKWSLGLWNKNNSIIKMVNASKEQGTIFQKLLTTGTSYNVNVNQKLQYFNISDSLHQNDSGILVMVAAYKHLCSYDNVYEKYDKNQVYIFRQKLMSAILENKLDLKNEEIKNF